MRIASALNFTTSKNKNKILYHFTSNHKFYQSLQLINNSPARPIYSIADLAKLWEFKYSNTYCHWAIKIRLLEADVPIYNQNKKGYVYLCDLIKLIDKDK